MPSDKKKWQVYAQAVIRRSGAGSENWYLPNYTMLLGYVPVLHRGEFI